MNRDSIKPVKSTKSDLQALLMQIDAQYEASRQALYGFAEGTSKHAFLNARAERLGLIFEEMSTVVGDEDEAMKLLVAHLDEQERLDSGTFC